MDLSVGGERGSLDRGLEKEKGKEKRERGRGKRREGGKEQRGEEG